MRRGDRVVTRLEVIGTQLGDWQGIQPTGKGFVMPGLVMRRIADGKIIERWDSLDWLATFQQLGLIPAM